MNDLRERIESAIRRHLEYPDTENITSFIADDVMAEIERVEVAYIRNPERPLDPPIKFVGKHFALFIEDVDGDFVPCLFLRSD